MPQPSDPSTAGKITREKAQQYTDAGGGFCPSCGSEDIEPVVGLSRLSREHPDDAVGVAAQPMLCLRCEAKWTDMFLMYGTLVTADQSADGTEFATDDPNRDAK